MSETKTIVIQFPVGVELPDGFEQALGALLEMVCKQYEAEHPGRVMWVFGMGAMATNFGGVYVDHPSFDDSILEIEIAEREGSEKELARRKRTQSNRYTKEAISDAVAYANTQHAEGASPIWIDLFLGRLLGAVAVDQMVSDSTRQDDARKGSARSAPHTHPTTGGGSNRG